MSITMGQYELNFEEANNKYSEYRANFLKYGKEGSVESHRYQPLFVVGSLFYELITTSIEHYYNISINDFFGATTTRRIVKFALIFFLEVLCFQVFECLVHHSFFSLKEIILIDFSAYLIFIGRMIFYGEGDSISPQSEQPFQEPRDDRRSALRA